MVYVLCSYDYAHGVVITGACVLCGVACLLFVLKRRGTVVGSVCCALFCLLVCGELAWSCLVCVGTLYVGPTQSSVDDAVKQSRSQAMELKRFDSTWCRADKTYSRVGYAARNEGMAFGYNALSTYCSSQNGRAVAFLERMGYSRENEFSVSYTNAIPVMDSMLGVRYVSSDECPAGYVDVGLMSVDADVVCELRPEGTRKAQARGELAMRKAQVLQSSAGHVVLHYESDEDGYLLVSLPNEPGWSVTVNGRAANVEQAYGGALMIIPVCTGLNHVELSFVPRGLVVGCAVSAISVVVCLVVKRSRRHIA